MLRICTNNRTTAGTLNYSMCRSAEDVVKFCNTCPISRAAAGRRYCTHSAQRCSLGNTSRHFFFWHFFALCHLCRVFLCWTMLVADDLHGHRTSPITVRMLMHRFHSCRKPLAISGETYFSFVFLFFWSFYPQPGR